MAAPVRRHLLEDQSGYRLGHPRLADLVRRRSDADSDERRLIEYCRRWQDNHSPYALGYLIRHLLDAGDHEAVWHLLVDDDGEGSNPWYLAHLDAAAEPPVTGGERGDWLRWYLADLDAMVRHTKDLRAVDGRLAATIRLRAALVHSTFASVARRVPDGLLQLLAEDDIHRAATAMTLAQLRSAADGRAAALIMVAGAVADPVEQRATVREALQVIAESHPQDRARHLAALAPIFDPAEAAEAAALLGSLAHGGGLKAAVALGPRMADDEQDDFLAMVRASISTLDDPVAREGWLAQIPGEAGSTADAFIAAYDALGPETSISRKTLIEVGLALVGPHPGVAPMLLDLITREEAKEQPALLASLADAGPDDGVIPCINALLELESSSERGSALAVAVSRLDANNTTALLYGPEWDFDELSLIVPGLRDPQRREAAAGVLAHISGSAVTPATVKTIASVVGRIGPYLDTPEHAEAVRLLEECAAVAPRVPLNEEIARQAIALLRIEGEDGLTLVPAWRAGITRADVLTLLASVDQARRQVHVNAALRATLAVGDASAAAQLLADLGKQATAHARERLARAAVDAALTIEWPATLAATLLQIIPMLPEHHRFEVRGALQRLRDTPDRAEEVELMLLAQERPLPAAFTEALPDAAGRLDENVLKDIVSCVATDLPDAIVESVVSSLGDKFQASEGDTAAVYAAIAELAQAGRLTLRQADRATGGGRYQVDLISVLLATLEPNERDELTERALQACESLASVPERIVAFGTLRSAVSASSWASDFSQQLEDDLASLDLEVLPPKQLAQVAPYVPEPAASLVWRHLLDRRLEMDPFDWAGTCLNCAADAPTSLLPEILASLAPAIAAWRTPTVAALSAEIVARGDDTMARSAWIVILEMAERDLRPEFLEQLRGSLPLAKRVLGDDMIPIIADAVQRIQTGFP